MDTTLLRQRAERLAELHRGAILVLPNVWDVASARVVEEAGFPALATSSAGIAAVLGYPDGESVSREEMLEMVARIARAVRIPVSADLEAGYGAPGETVEAALRAGAVGMNLEDGTNDATSPLISIEAHAANVRAARAAADKLSVPFVINARTDVYLASVGEEHTRFDHAVARAKASIEAGATSVFVPGVRDAALIGRLVKAIPAPLNVLAGPGSPGVAALAALGVARVSTGSGPARAALTHARRVAEELRDQGTYSFAEGILTHAQVNALFAPRPG